MLRPAIALPLISETVNQPSFADFVCYRWISIFSFIESNVRSSMLNYTSSPIASTCSLVIASYSTSQPRATQALSSPNRAVSAEVSSSSALISSSVAVALCFLCVGSLPLAPCLALIRGFCPVPPWSLSKYFRGFAQRCLLEVLLFLAKENFKFGLRRTLYQAIRLADCFPSHGSVYAYVMLMLTCASTKRSFRETFRLQGYMRHPG